MLVAIAVVLLAIGWARVSRSGERAVRASDDALAAGDFPDAVANAKLAAQCKGTKWSDEGFARLATIADQAETRNDLPVMKSAFVAMRSAADSVDDDTWRDKANEGLSRTAMRADAFAAGRVTEGCSGTGEPPCATTMKLELATPTHPSRSSHGILALVFAVAIGAGLFATRRRLRRPAS